jgi:hypothetical protein
MSVPELVTHANIAIDRRAWRESVSAPCGSDCRAGVWRFEDEKHVLFQPEPGIQADALLLLALFNKETATVVARLAAPPEQTLNR